MEGVRIIGGFMLVVSVTYDADGEEEFVEWVFDDVKWVFDGVTFIIAGTGVQQCRSCAHGKSGGLASVLGRRVIPGHQISRAHLVVSTCEDIGLLLATFAVSATLR